MSGKDQSVTSRESLMSTKPGRQIIKQALLKSKGYKLFNKYKVETETQFPDFAKRFAQGLLHEIKSDMNPNATQQAFGNEVHSTEIILNASEIEPIKSKLVNIDVVQDRVDRILNSNFVKMTFPVFNGLFDAAAQYNALDDPQLKQDMVEGHILAIDLSEPMDRIVDKDEDLEFLDDYKLMNPYILKLARDKISRGGDKVLKEFEFGFKDAMVGQYLDERLKSRPTQITEDDMAISYKKYRAVMGTAGKNMALAKNPLGEIFYLGMAKAAECVGCGNEIEDSIKNGFVKIPSWPLYYSLLTNDVKKGFKITLDKSDLYLQDARLALELLPDDFSHKEFLEFLFLSVEHYNHHWYNKLDKSNNWSEYQSKLPSR